MASYIRNVALYFYGYVEIFSAIPNIALVSNGIPNIA